MAYTPYKMKTSPMKRNFGVGEKEQANDGPKKGSSPVHKGIGSKAGGTSFSRIREKMAQHKAEAMAKKAAGAGGEEGGMAPPPGAEAQAVTPQDAGGGGSVEQHGPEAHTGGAGPQGGGGSGFLGKIRGMVGKGKPSSGGGAGAAMGGAGFSMFSDVRLKENIERTGISKSGIPTYEFNYIGGTNRYSGAMAQDLLAMNSDAVSLDASGYYKVNYNDIDVDMHLIN